MYAEDLSPANISPDTHHDGFVRNTPMFKILTPPLGPSATKSAARLGALALPGRPLVATPGFLAVTSRGAIPHVTPDNVERHTRIVGEFMALEDFVEKKSPPLYQTPTATPLATFTAMPSSMLTVLAPRRIPQVPARTGNTGTAISIFTSTGFTTLPATEYPQRVAWLRPDIAVPLVDLTPTGNTPASCKRMRKMAGRTEGWLVGFLETMRGDKKNEEEKGADEGRQTRIHVFAPVLPVAGELQREYLQMLCEVKEELTGLALYDEALNDFLSDDRYKVLSNLPRLALTAPAGPHDILTAISKGIDIVLPSFINTSSDAGIAFHFSFPTTDTSLPETPQPPGENMSDPSNATLLTPIQPGCPCYLCTRHHRAFLHHLLNAKEMLAWTLLQLHNFHVFTIFMAAVRGAIVDGSFAEKREAFAKMWSREMPVGTSERPRARGYHFKAEAGQAKANRILWTELREGGRQRK